LAPSLMHRRRVMEHAITYVGLDVHKDGHLQKPPGALLGIMIPWS
jgi:hypothetical protein